MNITQIFLSTQKRDKRPDLAPYISEVIQTVKDCHEEDNYTFYDNEAVEKFLNEFYDDKVLDAYFSLKPLAYRCDLARYCILNIKGGWYFDVGLTCLDRLAVPETVDLVAFRSVPRFAFNNWSCDNGLIYAAPQHPALEEAIDNVVQNVNDRYYGMTPLCPTGPSLWGRSIARSIDTRSDMHQRMVFGDCMELTPQHQIKNKTFVMPNGTLLAECKPCQGGDLKALGAKDTNNYNELWGRKNVYA